ncbi:hypothetical protein LINPERPRIM_LOCUS22286 [Linum perenne]
MESKNHVYYLSHNACWSLVTR